MFINNCEKYYTIGAYAANDEQLVGFRGHCPFRRYIKSKPARYGIKILSLTDCHTWYTFTMEIYVGKQPEGPYFVSNSSRDVVNRLVKTIEDTRRNVTMD